MDILATIPQPHNGNCKLTARFDDEEFDNILDIIISTFNLEKMEVNNQITLDGEGC